MNLTLLLLRLHQQERRNDNGNDGGRMRLTSSSSSSSSSLRLSFFLFAVAAACVGISNTVAAFAPSCYHSRRVVATAAALVPLPQPSPPRASFSINRQRNHAPSSSSSSSSPPQFVLWAAADASSSLDGSSSNNNNSNEKKNDSKLDNNNNNNNETTRNETAVQVLTLEEAASTTTNADAASSAVAKATIDHNGDSTATTTPTTTNADSATTTTTTTPTYRQLLVFTGTTVLIWLSEPLLSLVDTTVVGLTQGANSVTQLASLGPATTLLDSLLYLTYFLAIATTNQIAASRATGNVRQLQRTTSQTLGVATVLGVLTTAAVWLFGQGWLTRMAGASATPYLVTCATQYSCIRAAAAVPAVVGMVAQSVCLAALDTRTPAMAVGVASILNIVGDVALAPKLGVRGAALATAASNVASTTVLLRAVRKQMQQWRHEEETQVALKGDYTNGNNSIISNQNGATTKALPTTIPMFSWPDRKSFLALLKLVGPIFFVICAKIACYSAMTLRCTDFGVLPLAAHGIMMRLWFFFGCFGDSLSQTAQSYLPSTLYPKPQPAAFRKSLQRMLCIAAGTGILNSQVSNWILQHGGQLFTQDSAILQLMAGHRRFIGASLLLHPFIMALEGTVIAARDFTTLVATYAVTLCLHFGILKLACPSFPAVWRTFFLFQSIRLVNFATHVWQKQRHAKQQEQAAAAAEAALAA